MVAVCPSLQVWWRQLLSYLCSVGLPVVDLAVAPTEFLPHGVLSISHLDLIIGSIEDAMWSTLLASLLTASAATCFNHSSFSLEHWPYCQELQTGMYMHLGINKTCTFEWLCDAFVFGLIAHATFCDVLFFHVSPRLSERNKMFGCDIFYVPI